MQLESGCLRASYRLSSDYFSNLVLHSASGVLRASNHWAFWGDAGRRPYASGEPSLGCSDFSQLHSEKPSSTPLPPSKTLSSLSFFVVYSSSPWPCRFIWLLFFVILAIFRGSVKRQWANAYAQAASLYDFLHLHLVALVRFVERTRSCSHSEIEIFSIEMIQGEMWNGVDNTTKIIILIIEHEV